MRRFILVFCLLSLSFCLAQAEDVVRLESATGTASEYSVTELLRVELIGDSIRFIATDGTVAAEVYKYEDIHALGSEQAVFIDFDGHEQDEVIQSLLKELEPLTKGMRVIGSYTQF